MEAAEQAGCRLLLAGYYGDVLFTGSQYWAADLMREFRLRESEEIDRINKQLVHICHPSQHREVKCRPNKT